MSRLVCRCVVVRGVSRASTPQKPNILLQSQRCLPLLLCLDGASVYLRRSGIRSRIALKPTSDARRPTQIQRRTHTPAHGTPRPVQRFSIEPESTTLKNNTIGLVPEYISPAAGEKPDEIDRRLGRVSSHLAKNITGSCNSLEPRRKGIHDTEKIIQLVWFQNVNGREQAAAGGD